MHLKRAFAFVLMTTLAAAGSAGLAAGSAGRAAGSADLAAAQPITAPETSPKPRINGPRVFGARPGHPFFYAIPATGEAPLTFSASGLPDGLTLDSGTGIITGVLKQRGETTAVLRARNKFGTAERRFRIVAGDRIALTPPMGWNSWYCWSESVSDEKVRATAKAFVDKGLARHGWSYVNIDDCWQGARGGPLKAIQGNERFPDLEGLAAYVHSLGLKIGIYSTPWMGTYGGFIGGSAPNAEGDYSSLALPPEKRAQPHQLFGHYPGSIDLGADKVGPFWFVDADAKQFAQWGFDYIKYDWKPNDVPNTGRIARALADSGRDIVYSLSNEAPFENAEDWARLTNLWRTSGDIKDTWESVSRIGFSQERWAKYSGPGHWNDPDMLQVGSVGVPNTFVRTLKPTGLTPDEQITQVSLWSLLAAPLLVSCDLENIDAFTLNLLTNDEVIDVDQDPLGRAALPVSRSGDLEVWARDLEDGSKAVGLFNRGVDEAEVAVKWANLKISGRYRVRDLWQHKELGRFVREFRARVPSHGVVLVTVRR